MNKPFILLFSIVIMMTTNVFGEKIRDKILSCRNILSVTNRIICYDALADELSHEEALKPRQVIDAEHLFGLDKTARRKLRHDNTARETIAEIRSKVLRIKRSAQNTLIVYLENGQVWRQKKGVTRWHIKPGDIAVITATSMGSFRIKIAGKNKRVAAKRLK